MPVVVATVKDDAIIAAAWLTAHSEASGVGNSRGDGGLRVHADLALFANNGM